MEMKKHITDEKTGISYTLCGDFIFPTWICQKKSFTNWVVSAEQSSSTCRNAIRYC